MDTESSCQSCGQSITREDLSEGLAVRVDGRMVCSSCVDQLPGEAQLRINQLRAIRGLAATTYRMPHRSHPELSAFTFTTAMHMNVHRRELVATGHFDAPELPATGIARPVRPIAPDERKPQRPLALGAVAACIVVGVGLGLAVYKNSHSTAKESLPTPVQSDLPNTVMPEAPVIFQKNRTNFPSNASAAWQEASVDPHCPMDVLQLIAGELVKRHDMEFERAKRALDAGDLRTAVDGLNAIHPLPDHLLFRTARQQEVELAEKVRLARIATSAPAPVSEKPIPLETKPPEPKLPEVTHVTKPPPAPVAPPSPAPAIPAPAPEAVALPGDCFLLAGDSLKELPGRNDWKSRGPGNVALSVETGSLVGNLPVQGGNYQLWIEGRSTNASTIQVIIAGQRSQQLKLSSKLEWIRVEPATFKLAPGPTKIQVIALGNGSLLSGVYLAEALQPEPEQAIKDQRVSVPAINATPVAAVPLPAREPWSPHFAEPHTTLDPAIEANRVPDGLPGNSGPVLESTKGKIGARHGFTVDFTPADVQGGGIAVLLSPRRPDRTTLTVSAIDGEGRKTQLENLVLGKDPWQVHVIDLSRTTNAHQLLIEDVNQLSTGFLLAKIAVIAGNAPTAELLELRPPALLPLAAKDLEMVLNAVARRRKAISWRKDFNPSLVKILIGQKLTLGSWDTDVRRRFQEILAIPKLPNKTIETLVMQDLWLDALVKPAAGQEAVLDPAKHHLVILCTAGIEFPTGLDERQAFINFWKKLVEEILSRGVLAVPVLGPSKVDGDDKAAVELLWNDLSKWLADKHPGVPVFDLRAAAASSADRFAPGGAKLSIDLLGEGYSELLHRIEVLRKAGK